MTREGTSGRALGVAALALALAGSIPAVRAEVGAAGASHASTIYPGRARVSSVAAIIAVALRGDIYTVPVNGSVRRLTTYGFNSAPALSPREQLIAYLSTASRFVDRYGAASTHSVWIVAADGFGAHRITVTDPTVDRGGLSWSPDGQRLAYFEGDIVVVSDAQGKHRTVVLRTGRPFHGTYISGPIAWSPDGQRIAVTLPNGGTGAAYPREQRLAITDVARGATTIATIRFPSGALGHAVPPGSYPGDVAWAPDGRGLVVETLAKGEGPARITGLWRVAAGGGLATLFVGSPFDVRNGNPAVSSPLRAATHVLFSPDGRYLAADPEGGSYQDDHFWIADPDGAHGRFLPIGARQACALAQYTWLNDSAGIAYVAVCATGQSTSAGPTVRATLYAAPLNGRPRALLHVDDPRQDVLQLTPAAYRCVLCGY